MAVRNAGRQVWSIDNVVFLDVWDTLDHAVDVGSQTDEQVPIENWVIGQAGGLVSLDDGGEAA